MRERLSACYEIIHLLEGAKFLGDKVEKALQQGDLQPDESISQEVTPFSPVKPFHSSQQLSATSLFRPL